MPSFDAGGASMATRSPSAVTAGRWTRSPVNLGRVPSWLICAQHLRHS